MQIVLSNNERFSYTIKQVEKTNILGAAVAVLDEYFMTNSGGESYKLYKTKERSWHEMAEQNISMHKGILMKFKIIYRQSVSAQC